MKRLWWIIAAGVLVRLILMPGIGFKDDVNAFTTWMLAIATIGPHALYADTSGLHFPSVDYPPGYLYILWLLGIIVHGLFGPDPSPLVTRIFIKIPAVLADFGIAVGVVELLAQIDKERLRLRAWAILLLAPMLWLVSAYWGQVDSVAAVCFVWTLVAASKQRFLLMWVLFALAVSLKPQPVVCAPILFFFQFACNPRSIKLLLGPALAIFVAYLIVVPFAPSISPIAALHWLIHRYLVGVAKYPYNSTGAFNIFTVFDEFYTSDARKLAGVSLHSIGLTLFGCAAIATLVRTTLSLRADRSPAAMNRTLIIGSFMMLLSLFMLTTRMHERYLMTAIALIPLVTRRGRLSMFASVALCTTFTINVAFILKGFYGGHHHPFISTIAHVLSGLNVLLYGAFWYLFLTPSQEIKAAAAAALRADHSASRCDLPYNGDHFDGTRAPIV